MHTASLLLAAFLTLIPTHARSAETFPERPVRILTGQTGGGSDIVARLLAPALTERLGQQAVVDNRAGGIVAVSLRHQCPDD